MANVGPLEILVVLVIALVVFGPKRLPELGRSLGEGIKGFKGALDGHEEASAGQEPTVSQEPTARQESSPARQLDRPSD